MPRDGTDDGGSSTSVASREDECSAPDKHAGGEKLFREMGRSVGIEDETLNNVIQSVSGETWRKRRAGLHLFLDNMNSKKLHIVDILHGRSDIILAKALT
ncbi:MAG: hypothetical protein EZS28_016683 [Streblomastix strix]|uniref:Uncharacterized protein n=1 Tax=Streblomastix strix TaxID=222440 RepID=A0A5J4VZG7_9EUKA|nr:MAG: hypothetical protein EZS28_016683 [Streblomastix strix]